MRFYAPEHEKYVRDNFYAAWADTMTPEIRDAASRALTATNDLIFEMKKAEFENRQNN